MRRGASVWGHEVPIGMRKAGMRGGGVVRYLITRRGPEPLRPGDPLPNDIDRELDPIPDGPVREALTRFAQAVADRSS